MIEKAVDFVLSKINLYVGDRSKSVTVDVEYEIPKQAVTEAIVNAVAHRDYTSNGSVQVMLFADRFEVSNPGNFPHELTIEQLYTTHRSIPANPLLAEAMYLRGAIERMGTGTQEMTKQCVAKGLSKPEFIPNYGFQTIIKRNNRETSDKYSSITQTTEHVTEHLTKHVTEHLTKHVTEHVTEHLTEHVTAQVEELINILDGEMSRPELQAALKLSHRENFRVNYLMPALKHNLIEMTIPDKPKSVLQKYRLTDKGKKMQMTIKNIAN